MAKYQVEFSCGHSEEMQLFGPHKERERKIEWFESHGQCSDCYRAAQDAQRKQQTEAAVAASQAEGLPALAGSEKQVAWAETLRREKLSAHDRVAEVIRGQVATAEAMARAARIPRLNEELAAFGEFRGWLREQVLAKFWIDSRGESINLAFRKWCEQHHQELLTETEVS